MFNACWNISPQNLHFCGYAPLPVRRYSNWIEKYTRKGIQHSRHISSRKWFAHYTACDWNLYNCSQKTYCTYSHFPEIQDNLTKQKLILLQVHFGEISYIWQNSSDRFGASIWLCCYNFKNALRTSVLTTYGEFHNENVALGCYNVLGRHRPTWLIAIRNSAEENGYIFIYIYIYKAFLGIEIIICCLNFNLIQILITSISQIRRKWYCRRINHIIGFHFIFIYGIAFYVCVWTLFRTFIHFSYLQAGL